MWLCVGISPVRQALQTQSKAQKTLQVFYFALGKKNFGWGCGFLVSDGISGGLSGHLGPLHLALDPNR